MRRQISAETPLVLGLQHQRSGVFADFRFTCFEWIPPGSLFQSSKFNLENLCAAGTEEGSILLFTKQTTSLAPVCLLCGHQAKVTDIKMSLQPNTFLSVSEDGAIYGWHTYDATCRFVYDKLIDPGENYIYLSSYDVGLVWIWTLGLKASLIDVIHGKRIFSIDFCGLLGFCALSPNICNFVSKKTVVCIGLNYVNIYEVNENQKLELVKIEDIPFSPRMCYECSNYGIIQYSELTFSIILLNPMIVRFSDNLNDNSDIISKIIWDTHGNLIVGTYKTNFIIYEFDHVKRKDNIYLVQNKRYVAGQCSYLSGSFAINNKYEIAFCNNFTSVNCISNGQLFLLSILQKSKLAQIVDQEKNLIVMLNNNNRLALYDLRKSQFPLKTFSLKMMRPILPTSYSLEIMRGPLSIQSNSNFFEECSNINITSLASRVLNFPDEKRQIIAGASNGCLYYFTTQGGGPIEKIQCCTSSIIGIAILPKLYQHKPALIAVGEDGSCALVTVAGVNVQYAGNQLPTTSVRIDENQEILMIGKSDRSFLYYDLNSILPFNISMLPCKDSIVLWSSIEMKASVNVQSLNCFRIGQSSVFFSLIDVAKYSSDPSTIFNLLSPIDKSKSMDNLSKQLDDDNMSFLLLGIKLVPTFFYQMFRLQGQSCFECSPYNAVVHFLSYQMLGKMLNYDIKPLNKSVSGYVSILTQLLFVDNEKIQKTSLYLCADAIGTITRSQCDEIITKYIQFIKVDNIAEYDMFLLGIIIVSFSDLIPNEFVFPVFDYMKRQAYSMHVSKDLAIIILIDGIDAWVPICQTEQNVFKMLLPIILRNTKEKKINEIFYLAAAARVKPFFDSVLFQFDEFITPTYAKSLILFVSQVALSNKDLVGPLGSRFIAHVGSEFRHIQYITTDVLDLHSKRLKNVEISNDILLIGTQDGSIFVYEKGKFIFSKRLFSQPISAVSIGPGDEFAVAVSTIEMKMIMFRLKQSFFKKKTKFIVVEQGLKNSYSSFSLIWKSESNCNLRINQ